MNSYTKVFYFTIYSFYLAAPSVKATDYTNNADINSNNSPGLNYSLNIANDVTNISNTGNITTTGNNAPGININSTTPNTTTNISNSGKVYVKATNSKGILFTSNQVGQTITVNNTGNIIFDTPSRYHYGIEVRASANNANITINNNGVIGDSSFGIVAWNLFTPTTGGVSEINLGSQSHINAFYGITLDLSAQNTINIANGSVLNGRYIALWFRNESLESPINTVNNSGIITSSEKDVILISSTPKPTSKLILNNMVTGNMSGIMSITSAETTINNKGIWNVQDRSNAIAEVTLGSNINNVINNTGNMNFINDTTKFTGLNIFNMDGGTLDLTSNQVAGTKVYIGTDTNSTFTANGGFIKLDVALGDDNSKADVLYVNNVVTGTKGNTELIVNNDNGLGALTTGDGIKVVDVQGISTKNAFSLVRPATAGAYEYVLGQGTGINANSWFLRNIKNNKPIYNPNGGLYLMNQYAAINMFNMNLLDRRDAAWAHNSNVWMRINHSRLNTDLVKGTQHADIDTTIVQIGADLYQHNNTSIGIFGGYGHSKVYNQSKQTKSKANGSIDGYQIGAYASWIPQEIGNGPYIDTWTQYAWYNNELSGKSQIHRKSYDSSAWRTSFETGYAFELNKDRFGRSWILEPHIQTIYTSYRSDNFADSNKTRYSSADGNGFYSRLGTRLYGAYKNNKPGVSPFLEINWLYDGNNNSIKLNEKRLNAGITKNIAEIKTGLEGHITDKLSIWSDIGAQTGKNGYERYEAQIAMSYKW